MPFSPAVANLFPRAHKLTQQGNDFLALDHGPTEFQVLKNLGIEIPAPIMCHYDWEGGTPFHIQKLTAALLTTNQRAYVLNSFGTGKTKSALWAWRYLRRQGLVGRMLVVAPLSTLSFTWGAEVFKTLPGVKVQILHGTRATRLERLADKSAEIFMINHDGFATIKDAIFKYKDINCLCIDELAAYRNNTGRTKLMREYAKTMAWVWGMTGSPTPNSPTDAWSQATIITPNTVPKYFRHFRDDTMFQVSQFKYVPKPDALDKVYAALQPAVRFTLDDVVELPEKVERTMEVDLGNEQERVYNTMMQHARVQVQGGEIDAMNAGAVLNKLLQISTGYVYKRDGSVVGLDNEKRLDAVKDAVAASNNKVIIFVPFKHALAGVAAALAEEKIDYATVSGDTQKSARDHIFHQFQNTPNIRVIVAHPATMSHGLTLTSANTIVWFSPTTSLETFEQANARITRVGQKMKQLIIMLQGTKVEKMIYAKLRAKQKIQNALLEMFVDNSETEA